MGRKVKKGSSRYYFTQETEDAIIKYNSLDPIKDHWKRSLIFEKKIYFAFNKMAENLIHTFKFYYFDVPPREVQKQVVTFMCKKIDKFDSDKGKAFSYFSIIGKNYLIYHNNRNYNHRKTHINTKGHTRAKQNYIDWEVSKKINKNPSLETVNDYVTIIDQLADFVEKNINKLFKKQRDKNICYAVIQILKRQKDIHIIHKKALYVLIREYSGEKTMYITKVLKKIAKEYETIKKEHYNNKNQINKFFLF